MSASVNQGAPTSWADMGGGAPLPPPPGIRRPPMSLPQPPIPPPPSAPVNGAPHAYTSDSMNVERKRRFDQPHDSPVKRHQQHQRGSHRGGGSGGGRGRGSFRPFDRNSGGKRARMDDVDAVVARYASRLPGDSPADIERWQEERRRSFPTRTNVEAKCAAAKVREERGEITPAELDQQQRGFRGGRGGCRGRGGDRGRGRGGRGRHFHHLQHEQPHHQQSSDVPASSSTSETTPVEVPKTVLEQREQDAALSSQPAEQALSLPLSRSTPEHSEANEGNSVMLTTDHEQAYKQQQLSATTDTVAAQPHELAEQSRNVVTDSATVQYPLEQSVTAQHQHHDDPFIDEPYEVETDDEAPPSLDSHTAPADYTELDHLHSQSQSHYYQSRARIDICRFFLTNSCREGDACSYSHDEEDRREILLRKQIADRTQARKLQPRPRPHGGLRDPKATENLLDELLQEEKNKERNLILQCFRFIVKNNFFDTLDGEKSSGSESGSGAGAGATADAIAIIDGDDHLAPASSADAVIPSLPAIDSELSVAT